MNWKSKARAGGRLLTSRLFGGSAILLYHRVDEDPNDPFGLCVSPERFEAQIIAMKERWQAVRVSELAERRARGEKIGGFFAVTFDDGYIDVVNKALPVLERHGVPAAIYLVSGSFGQTFWWDQLMDLAAAWPTESAAISLARNGAEHVFEVSPTNRSGLFRNLYEFFRGSEPASRQALLEALRAQLPATATVSPRTERRAVTETEARKLAEHPLIELGAHTVTHSQLSSLPLAAQAAEIRDSIERVQTVTGRAVSSFSYPFGLQGRDFTAATMRLAKDAGARCALAADPGAVNRFCHDFALPRIWVHNEDASRMVRRVKRWIK